MSTRLTPKFELGLNAIVHVLILYTALTFLFLFVVSKTETHALQGEFDKALTTNLRKALQAANKSSNGLTHTSVRAMKPSLEVLLVTAGGPNRATDAFNDGLFKSAYLVIAIFFSIMLTMLLVMAYASKAKVARPFILILMANIVLFGLVGLVEFNFFKMVATKYVPVKPSLVTNHIITSIKDEFKDT